MCSASSYNIANICVQRYAPKPDFATGTCFALIHGINRSLVAHLGAADFYSSTDFFTPENMELFKTVQIVYIEGFFITHGFDTAVEVVKLCKSSGIAIAFNICGGYLFENNFYKEVLYMIQNCDIVFGNSNEYTTFGEYYCDKQSNLKEVLFEIHQNVMLREEEKLPPPRLAMFHDRNVNKIVVCTQGSDPVLCVIKKMEIMEQDAQKVDEEKIVDTTGAGDSFVGGFLASLVQGKDVRQCIQDGCWVASHVIQKNGCTFVINDE